MQNSLFRQYYVRLRRERIVKSLLWGAAFGLLAAFVCAFATWMTYFQWGFFLTLGVFAAVTAGVTFLCYFRFFRPTAQDVARRVDALGLEERMITMLELRESDEYIAMRQREDARSALSKLGMTKLKFGISLALILLLSTGGVLGLGMTTVTGLSDLGIIPGGAELIDAARARDPANFAEVRYVATEGGIIVGEDAQRVRKGEETQAVVAVADDGYRFYRWTDGYPYPTRSDEVTEDIEYKAWFLPMDDDGAYDLPGSDEATDQPPEDGNDDEPKDSVPSEGSQVPYYDYVIDWKIDYVEILDDYYAAAMEALAQGEMTPELQAFIETYFNTIG